MENKEIVDLNNAVCGKSSDKEQVEMFRMFYEGRLSDESKKELFKILRLNKEIKDVEIGELFQLYQSIVLTSWHCEFTHHMHV